MKHKYSFEELDNIIHANIEEAIDRFKNNNYKLYGQFNSPSVDFSDFKFPNITYNLKGKVAGKAFYKTHNIRLNKDLLLVPDNFEEMTLHTPLHELAHLIVRFFVNKGFFNRYAKPHGEEWKNVMCLLGEEPTRTHNMKIVNKRKVKKILYVCDCTHEHWLTSIKHNKIQKKHCSYICKNCSGVLRISDNSSWVLK